MIYAGNLRLSLPVIAESKRSEDGRSTSQPYPDIRLPLEMKMALNSPSDKPSLRATCDIPVGHVWGPYRTAGIFRNISPAGENNSALVYREITILVRAYVRIIFLLFFQD